MAKMTLVSFRLKTREINYSLFKYTYKLTWFCYDISKGKSYQIQRL